VARGFSLHGVAGAGLSAFYIARQEEPFFLQSARVIWAKERDGD